jgi:hypothetical protein
MTTMNIIDMIKEGLRIARSARSLWLYGFFVGLGAAVNNGNQGHAPGAPHALTGGMALLAAVLLVLIAAGGFMYFVSQAALIEGVARLRRGSFPTVHDGWRGGLAHWGVLLRMTLIYLATTIASVLVLAAPSLLALKLSGTALAVIFGVPAAVIAVLWLVTLYMWQQFASRIAVLENRRAWDAIGKARLFLHGRLMHGLKVIVAAILGRLVVVLVGVLAIGAAGAAAFGVLKAVGLTHAAVPVIVLGSMAVLPAAFILIAVSGTTQSSIWTLGYLTQEGK